MTVAEEYVAKREEWGSGYQYETLTEFIGSSDHRKMWLIKGAVAWGETSAWVGPPGSLKSALMADLSISIAFGRDWHGKKGKGSSSVLYFALERADLVRRRLEAQITRLGLDINDPKSGTIVVVPATVDFVDANSVAKVVRTVKNVEAFTGEHIGIIIFDTFAKLIAASGGDEDKAKDQGKLFANIQRMKDQLGGPHVALVGHTGKDETRGSRGSNAILGDADVMVVISGDEIKTATVTKANDMPEGPLFSFKSDIHEFGTDEDGDPITVNIVSSEEVSSQSERKPGEPKLSANQRVMFRLLHDAGTAGLSVEAWNEQARALDIGKTRKAILWEIRESLRDKGLVREYNGRWTVTS
jgi:hypothetical protein